MTRTANIDLPLVQAAQAQKHVTVNEAFALLDAAAQLVIESVMQASPPNATLDGTVYHVPAGATGDWATQSGKLAVSSNGGWVFIAPQLGWRGWVRDIGKMSVFDGVMWQVQAVAVSPNGAASVHEVLEIDVVIQAGSSVTSIDVIPANSVVFGVSGIVTQAISGDLGSWSLGVPGAQGRYGAGLGLALGSWLQGVTSQPQAYYSPTSLVLEASGGDFAAGTVRLAVHLFRMTIPRV
ncbi:DUF2793 domain-containing protein [Rhodobacteraceae bacterium SC52]|nr:DUF2793 domain-containing protein [Rhodobacteraceae bacterium SC52]